MKYLFLFSLVLCVQVHSIESICFGISSNGRLKNGVLLPAKGNNFVGYSYLTRIAGRTYVHSEIRDILVDAYGALEQEQPNKVYKYAETGFKQGGEFKPHKTHRNGLSVDFITPVIDEEGQSVHLSTHLFNRFGYDIEFDVHGQFDGLKIDYEALAAHLVELHKGAIKRGHKIWRVIFDPNLQPNLLKTQYAQYLRDNITFSTKRSRVRHDEHYHVDFIVPCAEL